MIQLSPQAQDLLRKRYCTRNEETWADVCRRVAQALTNNFEEAEGLFNLMSDGVFLPNTPAIVNAGKENFQPAACFVLPIEDSIQGIFKTLAHTADIFKSGGGVGINFSSLRPEGFPVKSTQGIASGPISFMKVFDSATQELKQGGVRRGALMGILDISHPDIVKFIKCKDVDGHMANFNISVGITDEFLRALKDYPDEPWICHYDNKAYCLDLEGQPMPEGRPTGSALTTYDIWKLLAQQAWKNGEPGMVFIDRLGAGIRCTNPCGEVPLEPYGACVLGSINLSALYPSSAGVSNDVAIDFIKANLLDIVPFAVQILNNMLDKACFPLNEIDFQVRTSRRIGLGIMGWADLLIKLGIVYGSEESFALAEELSEHIYSIARATGDAWGNTSVMAVAPTGSISILAGCSAGIEPNYAFYTKHHREDFGDTVVVHPLAAEINCNPETIHEQCKEFVRARDVPPLQHLRMQAIFQKMVDGAVSKTIGLPETATGEDVRAIYNAAAATPLIKGITVYRDGSRKGQVLSDASKPIVQPETKPQLEAAERPYSLPGKTYKLRVVLGDHVENVYIHVTTPDDKPYEVFVSSNVKDAEPWVAQFIDSTTRLISLALRYNTPLEAVIKQLEKVPCGSIFSLPHKIAFILQEYLPINKNLTCPECGANVIFAEGCMKCSSCAWGKCG